ncbi:MAG: hypothetical protein E7263_08130 [Lachnospiraceae bacterium]|nr:hypothetical protein [Lachnospiraceae bacterium]
MNKRRVLPVVIILLLCALSVSKQMPAQAKSKDYITTDGNIIWQKEYCYGLQSAPYAKYENYQGKIKFTFNKYNQYSGRFDDVYDDGEMYSYITKYDKESNNYKTISGTTVWGQLTNGSGSTLNSVVGLQENTVYMLWSWFDDVDSYNSYLVVEFIIRDGVVYFGRSISDYTEENYLAGIEFFDYVNKNYKNVLSDFEKSLERYEANEIYEFANELVEGCTTDFEKTVVLHRWLVENIIYKGNDANCADCKVATKHGICGDISVMTVAMFNSVGIPCVEISSVLDNHAWNMIYVDGKWLTIDNTNGQIYDFPTIYYDWTTTRVVPFNMADGKIYLYKEYWDVGNDMASDENIAVGEGIVSIYEGKTCSILVGSNVCINHNIEWKSGDESILRIDSSSGNKVTVTALKQGRTTITCTRTGSKELSCTYDVYVVNEDVDLNQIEKLNVELNYITHVQSYGWQGDEYDESTWYFTGSVSGTTGSGKRLEGIKIKLDDNEALNYYDLGIQYTTHCQSYGWLPWSANGEMNGTEGEAKRLEAIKIQLTGADKNKFSVYYRVHAQSYGWLNWAKNGAPAGTAGLGKRLEAIQIVVLRKDESEFDLPFYPEIDRNECYIATVGSSPIVNYAPTSNTNPVIPGADAPNVAYRTHVQSFGWQGWKYNGQMSGTSGLAKRLEGININLTNKPCDGDIVYTTHVQTYGWKDGKPEDTTRASWKKNGAMSGTSGEAKRLEAICIDLTGEMGEKYDIYYRVHAQSFGWLGWAKNGEESGTAGYAKRLEGIQIVLVPKGGAAPGNDYGGVTSDMAEAYVEK